jgi:hypothetical protein
VHGEGLGCSLIKPCGSMTSFFAVPFIEVLVSLRRLVEAEDHSVDDLGDRKRVTKNSLHEPAVEFEHGSLTGLETVRFRSPKSEWQQASQLTKART